MRYLVTGGAGFIGGHLVERLTTESHTVVVLDINRPTVPVGAVYYVQGDVRDRRVLGPLVAQADAVFHLAAVVGFAHVMGDMRQTVLTNTEGTAAVLLECQLWRKRVLLTSTSACYGRATNGNHPVRETDDGVLGPPTTTSWSYAYAKAADECLAFAYHREHQVPVIVTRLFNTVGPRQSAEAGFVLPRFVQQALTGQPLTVYAPGTQTRTFGHVRDVVDGLARLMECDGAVGELVNLGGSQTISMWNLAEYVRARLQSSSPIEVIAPPYGVGYDNVVDRTPDLSKVGRLIGYTPRLGLAEMIYDVAGVCV